MTLEHSVYEYMKRLNREQLEYFCEIQKAESFDKDLVILAQKLLENMEKEAGISGYDLVLCKPR